MHARTEGKERFSENEKIVYYSINLLSTMILVVQLCPLVLPYPVMERTWS